MYLEKNLMSPDSWNYFPPRYLPVTSYFCQIGSERDLRVWERVKRCIFLFLFSFSPSKYGKRGFSFMRNSPTKWRDSQSRLISFLFQSFFEKTSRLKLFCTSMLASLFSLPLFSETRNFACEAFFLAALPLCQLWFRACCWSVIYLCAWFHGGGLRSFMMCMLLWGRKESFVLSSFNSCLFLQPEWWSSLH